MVIRHIYSMQRGNTHQKECEHKVTRSTKKKPSTMWHERLKRCLGEHIRIYLDCKSYTLQGIKFVIQLKDTILRRGPWGFWCHGAASKNCPIPQKLMQQSCVRYMETIVKKWKADELFSPWLIADKPLMILQFLFSLLFFCIKKPLS